MPHDDDLLGPLGRVLSGPTFLLLQRKSMIISELSTDLQENPSLAPNTLKIKSRADIFAIKASSDGDNGIEMTDDEDVAASENSSKYPPLPNRRWSRSCLLSRYLILTQSSESERNGQRNLTL